MEGQLLWTRANVKESFQKDKNWPSFVGAVTDPNKVSKGFMPVALWPEQMRMAQIQQDSPHQLGSRDIVIPVLQIYGVIHNRGYFVGPGDNYGGDYALYEGDSPMDSHAIATVRVFQSNLADPRDIVAFCRVQNQVAKSAVLTFPVSNTKNVSKEDLMNELVKKQLALSQCLISLGVKLSHGTFKIKSIVSKNLEKTKEEDEITLQSHEESIESSSLKDPFSMTLDSSISVSPAQDASSIAYESVTLDHNEALSHLVDQCFQENHGFIAMNFREVAFRG